MIKARLKIDQSSIIGRQVNEVEKCTRDIWNGWYTIWKYPIHYWQPYHWKLFEFHHCLLIYYLWYWDLIFLCFFIVGTFYFQCWWWYRGYNRNDGRPVWKWPTRNRIVGWKIYTKEVHRTSKWWCKITDIPLLLMNR